MQKILFVKILLGCLVLLLALPYQLSAQEITFNPNFLIADNDFFNSTTLDEAGIQQFLASKGSHLATWTDPLTQMKPARIINYAAQDYGINPRVILVTLQKEQSLIENGGVTPSDSALDWAMGYGVCDGCSKSDPAIQGFKGFFNQVKYGTAIFNRYYQEILQTGQTRSGFGPAKPKIVSNTTVVPQNYATALLYTYTPHLHGNQNFVKIWNKWFSFSYPDGTLLQPVGELGVYLIENGQRRPFTSQAALTTRGYKLDKVIQVEKDKLSQYPIGPSIKYPQYALLAGPDDNRYLLVNDSIRPFASYDVFRQLGFNPEELEILTQSELDTFSLGRPITLHDAYPTGALLQNKETGSVFFVEGNVKHPIVDKSIMVAHFGPRPSLIQVDSNTLRDFVIGAPLKLHDGELVIAESGEPAVYVVSQGLRRPIISGAVFEELGYSWDDLISVPVQVLDIHPLGEIVKIDNYDTSS